MTDEQWKAIEFHVASKLKEAPQYEIMPDVLAEVFNLSRPFFGDFLKMAEKHQPDFDIKGFYWNKTRNDLDPADIIRFSR